MSEDTLGQRVKKRRKELRMSQVKLANAAGIGQSTLVEIETGVTNQPRSIVKLAEALRMTVEELTGSTETGLYVLKTRAIIDRDAERNVSFAYIRVRGEVSAGVWRAMEEEDAFETYEVPIASDPRFPPGSLFGLIVRGSSVDKFARDGEIAVCLDIWQSPRPYQHDDLVVVRRRRAGEHETTIKQVRWHNKVLCLFTASNDPRFDNEAPLNVEHDGESDVEVIGLALNFVRIGTRL